MTRYLFLLTTIIIGSVAVFLLAVDLPRTSTVATRAAESRAPDSPPPQSLEEHATGTPASTAPTPATRQPAQSSVRSTTKAETTTTTTAATTTTTAIDATTTTSIAAQPSVDSSLDPIVVEIDADPDPPVTSKGEEAAPSKEGQVYIWHDGDQKRSVRLQTDLTVHGGADGDQIVVRGSAGDQSQGQGLPVFRSESTGKMMTLPGGVIVLFDSDWDNDQINSFFAAQGISKGAVSPMLLDNAFEIRTAPGFPALELANRLAGQPGVLAASPNWTFQATTK